MKLTLIIASALTLSACCGSAPTLGTGFASSDIGTAISIEADDTTVTDEPVSTPAPAATHSNASGNNGKGGNYDRTGHTNNGKGQQEG